MSKRKVLQDAAKNGNLELVDAILSESPEVFAYQSIAFADALFEGCAKSDRHSHFEIVKRFIAHGLSVNEKESFERHSPIMMAAIYGDVNAIERFIQFGAEIDAKNDYGSTALMCAATHGQFSAAQCLLKNGADVNGCLTITNQGQTPLMNASLSGHPEIAKLLIEHNADIDIKNAVGLTALDFASRNKHQNIVDILNIDYQRIAIEQKKLEMTIDVKDHGAGLDF